MGGVASAMPRALRSRVPAKMTSCMCVPRRDLALCSPRTQLTPSRMLDFPHPLGPTTTAMPVPGTESSVRSQKLLKPRMWIFFSFSILTPNLWVCLWCDRGHEASFREHEDSGETLLSDYRLYGEGRVGSTVGGLVFVDKGGR